LKDAIIPGILMFFFPCAETNSTNSTKSKPNFLVIISDDQTYNSINALNNNEIKRVDCAIIAACLLIVILKEYIPG